MISNKKGSRPSLKLLGSRSPSLKAEGMILLQTIVMVLILAMIAIMTLKWVLGRYMVTVKVSKSINCKALADACLAQKIAAWGGTLPAAGWPHYCSIETANDVKVTRSGSEIKFEVDYDDCIYR